MGLSLPKASWELPWNRHVSQGDGSSFSPEGRLWSPTGRRVFFVFPPQDFDAEATDLLRFLDRSIPRRKKSDPRDARKIPAEKAISLDHGAWPFREIADAWVPGRLF